MPIHEWENVPAGLFHHFHQDWTVEIARTLNRGRLPSGLSALVEQRAGWREGDVLAIESREGSARREVEAEVDSGVTTVDRPTTRIIRRANKEIFSVRANRIVVRHHLGRIVAVIEVVSPGNKGSRAALRSFVDKTIDLLREGIHVLIVDLFPPTSRDPLGIHKVIWDEIEEEEFEFPDGKDRILVSYEAGAQCVAYIEPIAVGDLLPSMPLFVARDLSVPVPLEETYRATWTSLPAALRTAVESGRMPDPEAETP